MTTTAKRAFKIGDKVVDRRDKKREVATIYGGMTHTNGSRKWYCRFPDMRIAVWEVDLVHVEPNKGAA